MSPILSSRYSSVNWLLVKTMKVLSYRKSCSVYSGVGLACPDKERLVGW